MRPLDDIDPSLAQELQLELHDMDPDELPDTRPSPEELCVWNDPWRPSFGETLLRQLPPLSEAERAILERFK